MTRIIKILHKRYRPQIDTSLLSRTSAITKQVMLQFKSWGCFSGRAWRCSTIWRSALRRRRMALLTSLSYSPLVSAALTKTQTPRRQMLRNWTSAKTSFVSVVQGLCDVVSVQWIENGSLVYYVDVLIHQVSYVFIFSLIY